MEVGFIKNKDIDQMIINYLKLSDIITLLKIDNNFRELIIVTSIEVDDQFIDFMNELIILNEDVLFDRFTNKLLNNCENLTLIDATKLVKISNDKLDNLIYNIISNILSRNIKGSNDIEILFTPFINVLLHINKVHIAKYVLDMSHRICNISINDLTYAFRNISSFETNFIINYSKLFDHKVNWNNLKFIIAPNIIFMNHPDVIVNHINKILNAAIELNSKLLLDTMISAVSISRVGNTKLNELIDNAIAKIS